MAKVDWERPTLPVTFTIMLTEDEVQELILGLGSLPAKGVVYSLFSDLSDAMVTAKAGAWGSK